MQDSIVGARRFSNIVVSLTMFLGGLGFFLSGLSSYFHIKLLPIVDITELVFLPQGLFLLFYGTCGILVSLFFFLTIFLDIGSGYNLYDASVEEVHLVRFGFPGPNRKIDLVYKFSDIKSVVVSVKNGLNPKREIFLATKDGRMIPLTDVRQPQQLSTFELKAASIAKFLGVSLDGLS
jgi:hypothetical protein